MKKGFLLLGIGCAIAFTGAAQTFKAHILQLKVNDLVYDSVTQRIYATIPSANGSNGNSIGVINPATYTLDTTIFAGSEPTSMALSGDGQYIYSSFSGSSIIRRFKVNPLQLDKTIQLGSTGTSSNAPLFANDIEVMPGVPLTIAVSLKVKSHTPTFEGVVIYDDSVKRPTATPGHIGSNQIEFAAEQSAQLYGYDNESSEFGVRRHAIIPTGITTNLPYRNLFFGFDTDFIAAPGKLYSTTGTAVDVTGTPYVSGQFGNFKGPVAYDQAANRVCYVTRSNTSTSSWVNMNGYLIFRRFDPATYLQSDSTAFSHVVENPLKLITCGPNCYALNTDNGKVIILKPQPASVREEKIGEPVALWHPNPARDLIQLASPQKVKGVTIRSIDGSVLLKSAGNQPQINLTTLLSGIYFVVIEGIDGQQTVQKLVKE